jgi:hypothetical protein
MITAEQAARALVDAAREWGVDPVRVFEPGNRRVRATAAESCAASGDRSQLEMLSRVFQVPILRMAGASA